MKGRGPKNRPPWLGEKLLESFCSYDFLSTVLWDLNEMYVENLKSKGRLRAGLIYIYQALGVIYHLYFKGKSQYSPNRIAMFKNNLIISFRNFKKEKAYSFINTLGLTVGLTAFILISMFVNHELSYDKFHKDHESIYRITSERYHPSGAREYSGMAYSVVSTLGQHIPEISGFTRVGNYGEAIVKYGDVLSSQTGGYNVEENFFDFFNFPVLKGPENVLLKNPDEILITETMAFKYFGDSDPLGQVLTINKNKLYKVIAVLQDPPKNTQFQFKFLTSLTPFLKANADGSWVRGRGKGFLKINPEQVGAVISKIDTVKNKFFPENYTDAYANERERDPNKFHLQPLADVYLKSRIASEAAANGDMRYMYIFSAIGLIILIIACVNYTNTAIARSVNRAKEVGVRKAIGASRGALTRLYISEAFLYVLISVALSILLIAWILPYYNQFLDKDLSFSNLSIDFILLMFGVILGITFLSGFYPAIFLSKVSTVDALKGRTLKAKGTGLKKALITFQFIIAQTLIIATVIIQSQLSYLQNTDIGYDREHLIYIPIKGEMKDKYEIFKNDVITIPGVKSNSYIYNLFANGDLTAYPMNHFEGLEDKSAENVWANFYQVQPGFINTMGMEMAAGTDFESEGQRGFIINEALARKIGWENPVGKVIRSQQGSSDSELPIPIIGVVRDFNDQSLKSEIKPIMMMVGSATTPYYYMVARLNPENISSTLSEIEAIWQTHVPDRPFDFTFYDDRLNQQYNKEMRLGNMLSVFASLSIGIAILGILGLSAFMVEQRMKEFSIRKVLGASIRQLTTIINRSFVWPIVIAFVFAGPLAYYWAAQQWLSSFAFRIDIEAWYFVIAILGTLLLTLLTVSYHSLKLKRVNPTTHLNSE